MSVLEDNDSLFFIKFLNKLGFNQRKFSRLVECSNVVNYWAMGYRKIPRTFKRFMLVLNFIHELDLLPQLMSYIEYHEKRGWGSASLKKTNWLEFHNIKIKSSNKDKVIRRNKC